MMSKAPASPTGIALFPMSENRLFMMLADGEVEFFRSPTGAVSHLVVYTAGREFKMMRK